MSPEVKNERAYGTKADIYSVGVVAYELFSGELPTYESL